MDEQNGHKPGAVRVKFDTGQDKDIPLSWAERMLIGWRKSNPGAFGKALAAAAMDEEGNS